MQKHQFTKRADRHFGIVSKIFDDGACSIRRLDGQGDVVLDARHARRVGRELLVGMRLEFEVKYVHSRRRPGRGRRLRIGAGAGAAGELNFGPAGASTGRNRDGGRLAVDPEWRRADCALLGRPGGNLGFNSAWQIPEAWDDALVIFDSIFDQQGTKGFVTSPKIGVR